MNPHPTLNMMPYYMGYVAADRLPFGSFINFDLQLLFPFRGQNISELKEVRKLGLTSLGLRGENRPASDFPHPGPLPNHPSAPSRRPPPRGASPHDPPQLSFALAPFSGGLVQPGSHLPRCPPNPPRGRACLGLGSPPGAQTAGPRDLPSAPPSAPPPSPLPSSHPPGLHGVPRRAHVSTPTLRFTPPSGPTPRPRPCAHPYVAG